MRECGCTATHERLRVVLTGGPGAGKTAVLELIRQSFCRHVKVLPESAGIIFGGGFPRESHAEVVRAAQRAIFFVQRELEAAASGSDAAIMLCDRGTVDGSAYWPGPVDLFSSVGTTLTEQLGRYDAVIHLRTPAAGQGYDHTNPLRIESPGDALMIDARIAEAWQTHPRLFMVEATSDFLDKARRTLAILRELVPECCRHHVVPTVLTTLERSIPVESSGFSRWGVVGSEVGREREGEPHMTIRARRRASSAGSLRSRLRSALVDSTGYMRWAIGSRNRYAFIAASTASRVA